MTTAHRPTFDPARGKDAQRGPAYHTRLITAHQTLKFRRQTQGTSDERSNVDFRAALLQAESAHYAKKAGSDPAAAITAPETSNTKDTHVPSAIEAPQDYEARKQKLLAETRNIDGSSDEEDADADGAQNRDADSDSESESDEDEEALLMRELAQIKKEKAEAAAKEAAAKAAKEAEQREIDIAKGNPLLNAPVENDTHSYGVKRRWDDDVVFKNQARGTSEKEQGQRREFVNDLLRSDFHKRFMSRYVR